MLVNDHFASPVTMIIERPSSEMVRVAFGSSERESGQHSSSRWEVSDQPPCWECTEAGQWRERKGNYLCMRDDCWNPPSHSGYSQSFMASAWAQWNLMLQGESYIFHLGAHASIVFLIVLLCFLKVSRGSHPSGVASIMPIHNLGRLPQIILHRFSEGT